MKRSTAVEPRRDLSSGIAKPTRLTNEAYEKELERLQSELLYMQEWIRHAAVGHHVVKYWLSVSDEEQERRFQKRIKNPHKRWKLSTIDLQARAHWVDYSEAKDVMFAHTDTDESPWWVVEADDKRTARLNLMSHLLEQIPYERVPMGDVTLPPRQQREYARPPKKAQRMVPTRYVVE